MTIAFARPKAKLKSILVVDEDPETLRVLRDSLAPAHWRIDSSIDHHEAAALLREQQSDVVLLNLEIGRAEGLNVLWLLRQVRPKARVIVITPAGTTSDVIRAIRQHVFSFFTKPLATEQLLEMIDRAGAAVDWEDGIEVLSANAGWISLRLRCRPLTAERLLQFFRELDVPLADAERADVGAAFQEVLLHAIADAGRRDQHQTVKVSYFHTGRSIIYLIEDPAEGFAGSGPASGFEALTARLLMDEVIYSERGNEVLLIKYLKA